MDDSAREQVEAFLSVMHERYGLSDEDIREFVSILFRLRHRSRSFGRLGETVAQAVIFAAVAAVFTGTGWAVIHFIKWAANHG